MAQTTCHFPVSDCKSLLLFAGMIYNRALNSKKMLFGSPARENGILAATDNGVSNLK
jgi:hypothetical protein